MILGRAHLPHSMFNLCEETLSRVKEYLNLGILQITNYINRGLFYADIVTYSRIDIELIHSVNKKN